MTSEANARLLAEFTSQVETACREGRGEALLKEFYRRQAEAYADSIYLRMEGAISHPETKDLDALFEYLTDFPHRCGLMLLEAVASTCVHWQMPREHQAAAETITGEAYRARLQMLLDAGIPAGAA